MLQEILGLKKREFRRVAGGLFAYYFKRISQKEFEAWVGDREHALRVKAASKASGYLLKNCKLFAYAYHYAVVHGEPLPKPKAFHVTERDAKFLRKVNLKHINTTQYRCFNLKEFDNKVHEICTMSEMQQHLGKLVSKKLSFIMKSYGVTREDLNADLYEAAISASYRKYPHFENDLHFTNLVKANIHNAAMSLISHHTTKARQQLLKTTDDAFESVNVDIANLNDIAAPDQYGAHLKESLQALVAMEGKVKPKVIRILMCLAGHHDEEFSEFLQEPNDEVVDSMTYEKYTKKVLTFFDVSQRQLERLFQQLREGMLKSRPPRVPKPRSVKTVVVETKGPIHYVNGRTPLQLTNEILY